MSDEYRQRMIDEGYTPSEPTCGEIARGAIYMIAIFLLLACIGFMCQHG
jgi:hypothetical protein